MAARTKIRQVGISVVKKYELAQTRGEILDHNWSVINQSENRKFVDNLLRQKAVLEVAPR